MDNPLLKLLPAGVVSLLMMAVQLAVNAGLKKAPGVPNKILPWLTLVLSLIGYTAVPIPANAAAVGVGVLGPVAIIAASVIQTFVVTGVHSFWKNAIKEGALAFLASLVTGGGKPSV